jgi:F0F1-type ATP synthase alpha subunit
VIVLFAGVRGFLDRIDVSQVGEFEKAWLNFIKTSHKEATMGAIIANKMTITKEIDALLTKLCDDFSKNFAATNVVKK